MVNKAYVTAEIIIIHSICFWKSL